MRKWMWGAAFALALVVSGSLASGQGWDETTAGRINDHMAQMMSDLNIPGAAVGIVQGDEVVFLEAYGVAGPDGRPMTPQTPMLLASVSKSLTALAVMQLVEAGSISLDDPVAGILNWFPYGDITVRHLLHHTSGFSLFSGHTYSTDGLTGPDAIDTAMRKVVAEYPPETAAGEQHEYSNTNYDLLALIVETISGQPFGDYLRENVFEPLEMDQSYTSLEDARANGLSAGYTPFFNTLQPGEPVYSGGVVGSAGIFSTADDLTHHLIAHLNGGQYGDATVLSAEGITQMHTPGYSEGDFWGYGMGWQRFPLWQAIKDESLYAGTMPYRIYHEGTWENFRSFQELLPESGWGVVVLLNTNDSSNVAPYFDTVFGILQILTGRETIESASFAEDWITANARWIGLALAAVWIMMALWSVRWIRLWRREPARRPRGGRRILAVLIPALLDLLILWFVFAWAPDFAQAPLGDILARAPDLRICLLVILSLALGWGVVRTVTYVWLLFVNKGSARPNPDFVAA